MSEARNPLQQADHCRSRRLVRALSLAAALAVVLGCRSQAELSSDWVSASQAALERGEPRRAISILEARLSFAPRDVAATTQLARVWLSLGHPSKAAIVLRALPSDVAVGSEYRSALARSLLDTERTAEAAPLLAALDREGELDRPLLDDLMEQLARGSWSDPLDREAANTLAAFPAATTALATPAQLEVEYRRLLAAGRSSEADAIEDIFLERYPTDRTSYEISLSRSRRLLAQGSIEPSLEAARRAAALDPTRAAPWVQQALALEALGRLDESLDALDRALAAEPADAAARDFWNRSAALRGREPSRRIVVEVAP